METPSNCLVLEGVSKAYSHPQVFSNLNFRLPRTATTAIIVGLGLCLLISNKTGVANLVVYDCRLIQTVPSLALLGLMIPIFGIRVLSAIIALFFYALLPIVRNEVSALPGGDRTLVGVSRSLDRTPWDQLHFLRLPLFRPAIYLRVFVKLRRVEQA